jgi:hypothetical protein
MALGKFAFEGLGPLVVASVVAALALASCTETRVRSPRDRSAHAVERAPAEPARKVNLAEELALPVVATLPSTHPVGDHVATIRVNEDAAGYGTRGRGAFRVGARIVASLAPSADAPAELHYAMTRVVETSEPNRTGWAFEVIDPTGTVLSEGSLPLCERCHAEAPREGVFEPSVRR